MIRLPSLNRQDPETRHGATSVHPESLSIRPPKGAPRGKDKVANGLSYYYYIHGQQRGADLPFSAATSARRRSQAHRFLPRHARHDHR